MPRKSRIDAAGALHHTIARGIERSPIFKNIGDRTDFAPTSLGNTERDGANFGELLLRDQKCAEKGRPSRQSSGRLSAATDFSDATFLAVMRNSPIQVSGRTCKCST